MAAPSPAATVDLDTLSINTIRFLSVDAVQKANSGHPGMPMGAAAMAYVLWTNFLKHSPANPAWPDRDRFVLSAGHGSALLYSLLHLTGYDLPIEEILKFRQWGSKTPGHPESHLTKGVETTTGPLGQGISNAVGMAIAEAHLAARYNKPGHTIVDHATWVIAGDGDFMEGVASEACSLAGHLRLGKLNVLYDANRICLAASTNVSFTEDVGARFAAYGWHVQEVADGNDLAALERAMAAAQRTKEKPSLVVVRTVIGYGSPKKAGSYHAHGSPLGPDEVKAAKENLGWPAEPNFLVPDAARSRFVEVKERGKKAEADWEGRMEAYAKEHHALASELRRRLAGELPKDFDALITEFPADKKGLASRKASESVMQALAAKLPDLMGGSADLNPSTFTWLKNEGDFEPPSMKKENVQGDVGGPWGYEGRNIHFGVREHGMGAIVNGMAYHGGFVPYGSTFFVFSDYMRPAVRLSALARIGSVWVYTHDSIGVGEDGPTHEPVEHLAAMRAIPDLLVIRPGDANETAHAWRIAVKNRHRPTALVLSRQDLPTLDRTVYAPAEGLARGAYILNDGSDAARTPDVILMATGSEVGLIVAAEPLLAAHGVKARLVSMPSFELFAEETPEYRDRVLPKNVTARLAVEAGVAQGWDKWIGPSGATLTMDRYGASAPGGILLKEFGFTPENVAARALALVRRT
jgi:transketolase